MLRKDLLINSKSNGTHFGGCGILRQVFFKHTGIESRVLINN